MQLIFALIILAAFGDCSDLRRCCISGQRHYASTSTCTNLPSIHPTLLCKRAASICCLRSLLDENCEQGARTAREQQYCPSQINSLGGGVRKECCDCCMLAKELIGNKQRCTAPTNFSPSCLKSFSHCCSGPVEFSYSSATDMPPLSDSAVTLGQMLLDDRCPSSRCEHLCTDTGGAQVQCLCRRGFELADDKYSCVDIDECLLLVDECLESQRCLNLPGSFKCIRILSCGTGYVLKAEKQNDICVDVNECELGTDDCGTEYICRNTQGSYRCDPKTCPIGEIMNPRTGQCTPIECPNGFNPEENGNCQDIDECTDSFRCQQFEECINTPGSYRCQEKGNFCSKGFKIDRNTGFCIDIDECTDGSHSCGSLACINVQGGYKCECGGGYEFNVLMKKCEDIDECSKFGGHVCSSDASCENSPGSFSCHCKDGYVLAHDHRTCLDVNECETGEHNCQQRCNNIPGSYLCICDRGFTLGVDGKTCEDVDECSIWSGQAGDLCMGGCVNIPGSYRCDCPMGYTIEEDGRTCKDIDECASGECEGDDRICVNTLGAFKCHVIKCPPNYVHDKNNKNRCTRKKRLCTKTDRQCKKNPANISWQYNSIPKHIRFGPDRSSVRLFTVNGPSSPTEEVQFELKLKNTITDRMDVIQASRNNFLLQRGSYRNSAVVALRDPLDGPQEIHLQLIMRLHQFGIFSGKFVANLIIYVSQYKSSNVHVV